MILTAVATGTDVAFTVSSNPGTATVKVSRFLGTNESRSFTDVATIVGDGSSTVSGMTAGAYLAVAVSGSTISEPITFYARNESDALHWRCLEAVREYILSLGLKHVSANPDDHVIVKLPYNPDMELALDRDLTDHCVMYFPKTEDVNDANNEFNSVDYGVQVLLVRKIGKKLTVGLKSLLMVREHLVESLTISPFPDLPEIHTVRVVPGQPLLPEQWRNSYDCSTVVFRCLTEQPAGLL